MLKVPMQGKILDFPDVLNIDISNLSIGDGLTCKDLDVGKNMKILVDEENLIVFVEDPARVKSAEGDEDETDAAKGKASKGAGAK
jgi:hypothetical protein